MGSIYKPKYRDKDGSIRESAIYWIKYYKNGKPIRESSNSYKYEAAKRLLKIREGRAIQGLPLGIQLEKVTFDELAQDYLNDYQINKKRSINRANQLVDHLKKFFHGERVVEITTTKIREYVAYRLAQKKKEKSASNGTINRELTALKRMLDLGARAGRVANLPYIEMLEEDNIRSGFFEHNEFLSILEVLPNHAKLPVTLAYSTGMRLGEVLSLRWDQVDLIEGKILLSPLQTKNKTPRMVYLRGELYESFLMAKELKDRNYPDSLWVCHLEGKQVKSIKRAWKTALKRVRLEGRLFHDFRRTAIRNMIRAGIPEKVAMNISGHKTRSVFDRYNIVSESDLKTAAEKIGSYHQSQIAITGKVTGKVIAIEALSEEVHSSKPLK